MTVEFFDLGQRLHAAHVGHPVLRIAASLFRLHAHPIMLQANVDDDGNVHAAIGTATGAVERVSGAAVLDSLTKAGAGFGDRATVQLIVPTAASLTALSQIAREHSSHEASAVIGWACDRAGYPGTSAVVNLLAVSRQRYITGGAPEAERTEDGWRAAFGLPEGIGGLAQWAVRLADGDLLPALLQIGEDDQYSFGLAAKQFAAGRDWSKSDAAPVAAVSLRQRCDTADLWSAALLTDRLWRHRATHTGHVCGGEVVESARTGFTMVCERMDSRLKSGTAICGWPGGTDSYNRATTFHGEIGDADAAGGALRLTVRGVRAEHRPPVGHWATVMSAAPDQRVVRSGQFKYRQKQFTPDSWMASGRKPGLARRDAPLDVLIAAAEREGRE